MIISLDTKKGFYKIQHPLMTKTLQKVGTEGTSLNIVKTIYNKPYSKNHTQWSKDESISSVIRNKRRMSTLTTFNSTYFLKS